MVVQLPVTAAHQEVQLRMAKPTLRTWLPLQAQLVAQQRQQHLQGALS